MSRRDVLKTSGLVPLVPMTNARWTDVPSATGLAGSGTGQMAIGAAEDVVFSDDFSTNTLDEYAVSQGGSRAGAGSVTWDSGGEQLLVRTGNNVTVFLTRDDVRFPESGSVRLEYVVHSDYHLTNDFAVRWQADDGDLLEWQVTGDAPDSSRFRDSYDDWVRLRRDGVSEVLDRTDGSVGPNSGERLVEASWTPSSMAVSVDGSVEASVDVDTTGIDPTTLTLSFNQGDVDLQSIVVTGSGGAGGALVWETAADWDAAVAESGVVHESVANTDHVDSGVVKQGYSVAAPLPSAGLVGYWPLQENSGGTAYDFSGNGFDGAVHGAMQGAPGLLGMTAYSFDGSNDVVRISSKPPALDPTEAHSFSVWYYRGRTNIDGEQLVCYSNGSDLTWGMALDSIGGGEVGTRLLNKNTGVDISVSDVDSGVGWNHVAHTWDPTTARLKVYVNGSEATNTNIKYARFGFDELTFGRQPNEDTRPNRPFLGSLAEARGYDRVLSASEVQALYDVATTPGTITTASKEAN